MSLSKLVSNNYTHKWVKIHIRLHAHIQGAKQCQSTFKAGRSPLHSCHSFSLEKLGPEGWVQFCSLCEAEPGLDSESPGFCFRFLPLHYSLLLPPNDKLKQRKWGMGELTVRKHRPLWEGELVAVFCFAGVHGFGLAERIKDNCVKPTALTSSTFIFLTILKKILPVFS